jgi:hypothetical protein
VYGVDGVDEWMEDIDRRSVGGDSMNKYDEVKLYNGQVYTGMLVGGSHDWLYPNGRWHETKVAPDKWEFSFESLKRRSHAAQENTGAAKGTIFHWYIIADQLATKLDSDSYQTKMTGLKFKVGHKRPYWRGFSYDYDGQMNYKNRIKRLLKEILKDFGDDNIDKKYYQGKIQPSSK